MALAKDVLSLLACPGCRGGLNEVEGYLECPACDLKYPIREGIPVLLVEAAEAR